MSLLTTLKDSFSDNLLNTGVWNVVTGGSATLLEQNSRIEVALPASSTSASIGRLDSVFNYDFTGAAAYLNAIQTPATGTLADAFLTVSAEATLNTSMNATNGFRFVKEGTLLYAQRFVAGSTTTITSVTFNATNHAWWKISEAAGTITWWTSLDGTTWTSFATYAHSMTITAMYLHVGAGCYRNETSPGNFYFDNVNSTGTSTDGQTPAVNNAANFAVFF